jgi:hypothetical protein
MGASSASSSLSTKKAFQQQALRDGDILHYQKKMEWAVCYENNVLVVLPTHQRVVDWISGYSNALGSRVGITYSEVQRVRAYLVRRTGKSHASSEMRSNNTPWLVDECIMTSSVFSKSASEPQTWGKQTRRSLIATMLYRLEKGKCVSVDINRSWDARRVSNTYARATYSRANVDSADEPPSLQRESGTSMDCPYSPSQSFMTRQPSSFVDHSQ